MQYLLYGGSSCLCFLVTLGNFNVLHPGSIQIHNTAINHVCPNKLISAARQGFQGESLMVGNQTSNLWQPVPLSDVIEILVRAFQFLGVSPLEALNHTHECAQRAFKPSQPVLLKQHPSSASCNHLNRKGPPHQDVHKIITFSFEEDAGDIWGTG